MNGRSRGRKRARQLEPLLVDAPAFPAALVSLAVPDVHGGARRWRMTGPGIPGETTLSPLGLPPGFVAARAEAVAGYPAGIDVLLVTRDGHVVGLPRTTTINEES